MQQKHIPVFNKSSKEPKKLSDEFYSKEFDVSGTYSKLIFVFVFC